MYYNQTTSTSHQLAKLHSTYFFCLFKKFKGSVPNARLKLSRKKGSKFSKLKTLSRFL